MFNKEEQGKAEKGKSETRGKQEKQNSGKYILNNEYEYIVEERLLTRGRRTPIRQSYNLKAET